MWPLHSPLPLQFRAGCGGHSFLMLSEDQTAIVMYIRELFAYVPRWILRMISIQSSPDCVTLVHHLNVRPDLAMSEVFHQAWKKLEQGYPGTIRACDRIIPVGLKQTREP